MSKTHLTMKEATECTLFADNMVIEYPELRFGQVLWNHIQEKYPSVANKHHAGSNDFFYWTDRERVVRCLLSVWIE